MHKFFFTVALTITVLFAFNPVIHAEIDTEKGLALTTKTTPLDVAVSADGKWTYILAKEGKVYVYSAEGKLEGTLTVDKSTKEIEVSPQGDLLYIVTSASNTVQQIKVDFVVKIDNTGAPYKGKANAPVAIVEFSDFECPYCSQVPALLDNILKQNPDTVKIVFRHYPLPFHKKAIPAALSAIAAHEQGKFFEYHDLLFQNQKQLSKEKTEQLAQQLGLNMEKFRQDLSTPKTRQRLAKDMQDARTIGVKGTPSLYVNGRKVKKRDLASIQQMINEELDRLNIKKK